MIDLNEFNANFMENLNYQLDLKEAHLDTISYFYKKFNEFNQIFKRKEREIHERIKKHLRKNKEQLVHQATYKSIVDEFKARLEKKNR